jgi:hypothetical protein
MRILEETGGEPPPGPPWAGWTGPADLPWFAGRFSPVFHVPHLFHIFSPREKMAR